MKKRIFAMLLSALLVANISACNYAHENEIDGTIEDTTFPESMSKGLEEADTETPSTTWEGTIACNGAYRTSKVKFAINQNKQLILYIEDWDESFFVPNEDMHFVGETVYSSSVVLGETQGALIFGDFSLPAKPIKVIRFTKGNPQVTIENLTFETGQPHAFKYCNFINEQTGYLFLFNEVNARFELTKMLKTTNGGETWIEQPVEVTPSIWWREEIICAKMVNENVGLIAGWYYSDENFSRRTYITADGGLTWSGIQIQYPKNLDGLGGEEACDILYEDGQYILICKFREDGSDIWVKYTSTDLKTWAEIQ